MNLFQTILLNIAIGFAIFIGFLFYWGRASGWFAEGGFVYEWWQKKRSEMKMKKKKNRNKTKNSNEK